MFFISDFVSSQDNLVQFGFWATIGAVVITVFLILYILAFRLIQSLHQISSRKFYHNWRLVLACCSMQTPEKLPLLHGRDHLAFLTLWNHYYEILKGEARENLIALAQRVDLANIARCQLFRNDKKHRLLGILTLGHLRSREDWPLLNQFLHLPDTYLSLVSMRACFEIHPQRAVDTLLPYLISRTDFPPAQVGNLLKSTDRMDVCPQLNLHMMLNLGDGSNNILRYMQYCGCEINRQTLEAILDKQLDDQILSTALSMINDPSALGLILPLAEHPRWHVRVHVATALGRLAKREQIPPLLKLVKDPQWWVRYRAAQALVSLPFLNRPALEEILDSLDDRYARDILRQAMAEV